MRGTHNLPQRRRAPGPMSRLARMLTLLFLSVFAALGASGAASAQIRLDTEAIETRIAETLARDRVPGAAVAIVTGTEVLFLRTYGRDGRGAPVTEQTAFRLGSMSKAVTALVAMRLVERGEITLETEVETLLPELTAFGGSGATLRHLLQHTSGLPARTPQANAAADLSEQIAALRHTARVAAPGTEHVYTSANYLVAARMLEIASGEDFEDLLRREALEPLGFSEAMPPSNNGSPPVGHRRWALWPVPYQPGAETGRLATASLTATAPDIARFMQFQLGDGRWEAMQLLSAAGLAAMHAGTVEGDGFRYALGWRDGTLRGARAVWHGGVLPDHQGKMILLPDHDVGIVVLLNVSSLLPLPARPTSHSLAADIAEMILGEQPLAFRMSYRAWLSALWVGLTAVMLHQGYSVARILSGRDPAKRPLRAAVADAAIMLALIVGLPLYLEISWPQFARQAPDLTIWIGVMTGLSAAGGLSRVRQWCKAPNERKRSLAEQ